MHPATDPPQPSAPLALAPRLRRRRTGPGAVRRALKHPRVMPYQRLIALVLLANLGSCSRAPAASPTWPRSRSRTSPAPS